MKENTAFTTSAAVTIERTAVFFYFKIMEIFDVPGLTLRHELKAGDLGRLIEFS